MATAPNVPSTRGLTGPAWLFVGLMFLTGVAVSGYFGYQAGRFAGTSEEISPRAIPGEPSPATGGVATPPPLEEGNPRAGAAVPNPAEGSAAAVIGALLGVAFGGVFMGLVCGFVVVPLLSVAPKGGDVGPTRTSVAAGRRAD